MEENNLVSVIIPVYNVKPFLVETLDSVINQTYKNLEIILVDDGSTDGSGEICEEYHKKDNRVQVIHQPNKGLSNARNQGLDQMKGNIVAFLDSDDAYHPDYISSMVGDIIQGNANLVICKFKSYSTLGHMVMTANGEEKPRIAPGYYDRKDALCAVAERSINTGVWNKIYDAELWKGIRFPDGHVFEDVDTVTQIINRCQMICVIDKPLYKYRKRPDSISKTMTANNISDWLLAQSKLELFIRANIPEIFTVEHLKNQQNNRINKMIFFYTRLLNKEGCEDAYLCREMRKQIIEIARDEGMQINGLRRIVLCYMICYCPRLLQIGYSIYKRIGRFSTSSDKHLIP